MESIRKVFDSPYLTEGEAVSAYEIIDALTSLAQDIHGKKVFRYKNRKRLIDYLAASTGLDVLSVSKILNKLEIMGHIKDYPDLGIIVLASSTP